MSLGPGHEPGPWPTQPGPSLQDPRSLQSFDDYVHDHLTNEQDAVNIPTAIMEILQEKGLEVSPDHRMMITLWTIAEYGCIGMAGMWKKLRPYMYVAQLTPAQATKYAKPCS